MHSSYALDVSDFSVERDGKAQPLSELWPGGYQPGEPAAKKPEPAATESKPDKKKGKGARE